jgi:hypothetical protein
MRMVVHDFGWWPTWHGNDGIHSFSHLYKLSHYWPFILFEMKGRDWKYYTQWTSESHNYDRHQFYWRRTNVDQVKELGRGFESGTHKDTVVGSERGPGRSTRRRGSPMRTFVVFHRHPFHARYVPRAVLKAL